MSKPQSKEIGRYKIQEELGRGGFGRVYRAFDPTVSRPVAVKVLTDASTDTQTRFRNEAMVAGNLRHKNIVTVYEYGSYQGQPFLAMEYLEGEDLLHIIATGKPLTLLEKCAIMSQVADGLSYAHSNGVVHRDMKPANIMVNRDGVVKIMDFGIARLTSKPDATRLTQQGFLIGTLRYMAPEQLAGTDFDQQCDIFAYGVIFYEFLTGRHPFEAAEAQSLMYKLSFEDPVPIREYAPDLPDSLQHVISRMIHKDRDRRYRTMKELQFDTEPIRLELQKGRASELLRQAEELLEQRQLEPARTVVQEALALEPSNHIARGLWERLQKQIQARKLRPRIESVLSVAEEHLIKRRFSEAVQALESALQLDRDNVYIQGRLQQARASVEQVKRASQLLAEARRHFDQQNLTAAYRVVSEVLTHDPKNPDAADFLRTLQEYMERRQEEQRIDEAVRKAEGLILIPDYDEAFAVLQAADPSSPKIRECLDRVRSQKIAHERHQKLQKELAAATDLLREQRLDEAAKCLEALGAEFPENDEVKHLLAYAEKEQAILARKKAIGNATADARSRAASNDYEGALAALGDALKIYPADSSLVRLLGSTMAARSEWEHRRAIESTIVRCESLRSRRQLAEAVQVAERALKEYDAEPALLEVLKTLEAELAEQRYKEALQKVVTHAEQLLSQKQHDAAADALQQALTRFPGDAALTRLLKRAQDAIRAREKAQAAERAAAIDRRGIEAAARAAAGDFDGALALLADGLRNWPEAAALHEIRKSTLAAQERHQKRIRVLQELEDIRRQALQESGSPSAPNLLALVTAIAEDYPGDQEIQSAAAGPIRLLTEIGRARQHLLNGDFVSALDLCRTALTQYPEHPAFREFAADAERRQRRAFLAELNRRAAATPDLHDRVRMLERGLELYPDESALNDQLRFARNKLALVDGIVGQARAHEQSGEWDVALEKWTSLLSVYEKYPGLDAEIERVRRAQENAGAQQAAAPAVSAATLEKSGVAADPSPAAPEDRGRAESPGTKGRPVPLLAAGVTAVILAGGLVAIRNRHTTNVPVAVATKVTAPVTPGAPPAASTASGTVTPAPPAVQAEPIPTETAAAPSNRAARLEIAGAVPGAMVKVDGRPVGETDVNGTLQRDVEPGIHTIELVKDDYSPATAKDRFRAGKVVRLDRSRVAMLRLSKPAPPPDPKQVDAQEWAQVAAGTDPEEFDAFIRNHPANSHVDQARARAADLRQQMRAHAAEQVDQSAWEKVDQNNRGQLQDYLSRFPSGAHVQQSRARIAEIDRHAAEAIANQHLKEQKEQKEQKDQEAAKRAADAQAIGKLLAEFEAAYNRKDLATLQKLWAGVPVNRFRDQFKDAKEIKFQLQLLGQPEVAGNSATAFCMRNLNYKAQPGGQYANKDRVKLLLARDGAGWVIRSIELN